ncbi:MAG: hypothetical protein MUP74_03330, partial [Desulfobacterales bacterium]|nr:hypothetical protein [Desulfobacterales bacterium]
VGKGPAGFGHYAKNYSYTIGTDTYDATLTDDKGVTIDTTSPIQYECQKSFIIFITDGLANYDNDWNTVTDVIGDYYEDGETTDCKNGATGCTGQGTYFDDVAGYLHGKDMRSDLPGDQDIITYVVGYQVTAPMLQQAAVNGGGKYYTTTNTSELKGHLTSAIMDILASISSGTAVSTISTSSESEDYLIRAKFLPNTWQGYLEAFTLPYADGDTAVWEAGAELASTTIANRNIYTYMNSQTPKKQAFAATNAALKTHLSSEWGVSEIEAGDGINTIRGESDAWPLGDIIYSTPTSVGGPKFYYTDNGYQTFKEDNRNRAKMIYVGANDGMLHAFQASDGAEAWAFIPENLQADLQVLVAGNCHRYYVDLTPLVTDIYDGSAWKTVLIGGNRLGGTEYFCLDVTDPAYDQFSVIWNHIPFSDRKSSTVPAVGKIQGGGIDKWLAIITSGYHEGTSDGQIAALNFSDGAKEAVWFDGTTTVAELATQAKDVSDPYYTLSSPAAVDSDDDGYLDLIYAGDTRGTLWKFYYDYVDQIWKKFALFQTGGQPITAKPDLVFDETNKLRIFFGTGKYLVASDKMNATRNAFYCLVEQKVSTADANDGHYTGTVALDKATDLVDTTNVKTQVAFDGLSDTQKDQINDKGWYFQLDAPAGPAERILEPSLTIAGIVFFTSFVPNSDVCGFGGSARLYAIGYKSSLPGRNEEDEPVLTTQTLTERYIDLGHGLPSKPLFYFDKHEKKSRLLIQTSDTLVHQEEVNLEARPMAVTSWRNN